MIGYPFPSLLDEFQARNRQSIRALVDGITGGSAIQNALIGCGSVQAVADALGGTAGIEAIQAQISSAAALTAALASPKNLGIDIRSAIGGAVIK